MNKIINKGPRTVPWGTQLLTVIYSDTTLPTLTLEKRPVMKFENQVKVQVRLHKKNWIVVGWKRYNEKLAHIFVNIG